jgi:hypothetical protein
VHIDAVRRDLGRYGDSGRIVVSRGLRLLGASGTLRHDRFILAGIDDPGEPADAADAALRAVPAEAQAGGADDPGTATTQRTLILHLSLPSLLRLVAVERCAWR